MESQRRILDNRVRELEAKTGMGALAFDESQRVSSNEHNDLLKALHVCEGQLGFFERTVQFQVGWIEWLQTQHVVLNQLRFGEGEVRQLPPVHRPVEEGVASSLSLCASFSRESFEQVRTLRNRIRIQLSVVANLIAQNDSRTNIAIADASRRIAFETRRDSDAMKTIAALTMVFLPATFVAVSVSPLATCFAPLSHIGFPDTFRNGLLHRRFQLKIPSEPFVVDLSCSDRSAYDSHCWRLAGLAEHVNHHSIDDFIPATNPVFLGFMTIPTLFPKLTRRPTLKYLLVSEE
ncbi:MAG: hypothetical protein L6R40_006510 [Gallowayella cf. fulva]|nr:MAG: hypothetical protein L6R40_006510 [Xanthomendoza cf. fulva]